MKVSILFSGGKDSNYCIYLAKKYGYKIVSLIYVKSKNEDSYMFQSIGFEFVKRQAKVLGIPLNIINTKGEKELELGDLKNGIEKLMKNEKIKGLFCGAIKSTYQSQRIQKICDNLNLICFNPLWQINEKEYLKNLLELKFKILIVKIASYPFTKKIVGKLIDKKIEEYLYESNKKFKTSIVGEGGEFETIVVNGPMFKNEIKINKFKIYEENENLVYLKDIDLRKSEKN